LQAVEINHGRLLAQQQKLQPEMRRLQSSGALTSSLDDGSIPLATLKMLQLQ
jgi:hypothetical protein